jgi:hypothetical protein
MGVMKQMVVDVLDMHASGSTINEISETLGMKPNEVGFIVLNFDEDPNYPDGVEDPKYEVTDQYEFDDIPF